MDGAWRGSVLKSLPWAVFEPAAATTRRSGSVRQSLRGGAGYGRLRGISLHGNDIDRSWGNGAEIRGPVAALMIAVSGRSALLDNLDGPRTIPATPTSAASLTVVLVLGVHIRGDDLYGLLIGGSEQFRFQSHRQSTPPDRQAAAGGRRIRRTSPDSRCPTCPLNGGGNAALRPLNLPSLPADRPAPYYGRGRRDSRHRHGDSRGPRADSLGNLRWWLSTR